MEHSNWQILAPATQVLLLFRLSDRVAAIRLGEVERITPMAELAIPPGLPAALEGVLNLAGVAIPVLRLDRLFGLPAQQLSLYSMLIILKASTLTASSLKASGREGPSEGRFAVLVDRVVEVLLVPEDAFVPLDQGDSLNGCAEAAVMVRDDVVHLLSPSRMLLAKERELLAEFQTVAQRRLQDWETRGREISLS